jgi:hypothetical protein
MIVEKILYAAVFINLIATFYYCKDIFKGHTKPNLVTWFFWALIPFIGVFFQIQAGARLSILPIFIDGFNSLLIILVSLSIKNGYWKIGRLDIACGAFSFMSLIIYILTRNLETALLFLILADFFPAIPTIAKAWKFPETESAGVYIVAALTNILGLLVIKAWVFSIYSFGLYFVLMNLLLVFCIYRKKFFTTL